MFTRIRNSFRHVFGVDYILNEKAGENNMARIDNDGNLFINGKFVGSYSRRRDAVRGAKRRGFSVA